MNQGHALLDHYLLRIEHTRMLAKEGSMEHHAHVHEDMCGIRVVRVV